MRHLLRVYRNPSPQRDSFGHHCGGDVSPFINSSRHPDTLPSFSSRYTSQNPSSTHPNLAHPNLSTLLASFSANYSYFL